MVDSKENYKFYLGVTGLTRSLMINVLHTFPCDALVQDDENEGGKREAW